ncbi:MAG: hypothetical protein A3E87_09840 [Gammaproteobacteria bacterium RIFCSPHIGHO2_12_FULL_35_23]|nr:MAG: hypothetical protein A3E87_09840 [Gammaproteobacteria bacterium RIFCSPHIGHO2_12_FULL_35_23]
MNEEKKLILEMVKEGKISVDEAEKLLESTKQTHDEALPVKSINRKFLRIIVVEENNTKVNINIPLALAEVGLKLIPKDKLKVEGKQIDVNEILKLIQEGNEGNLVNIETTNEGKEIKVKIFVD